EGVSRLLGIRGEEVEIDLVWHVPGRRRGGWRLGGRLGDQGTEAAAQCWSTIGLCSHGQLVSTVGGAGGAGTGRLRRRSSCASATYASAPLDLGSYRMAGRPWLGASARRTLRGMTVSNTLASKNCRI